MITGVLMNWKRPGNVVKILDGWEKDPLVDEAIVWNNNKNRQFPAHKWAKVINTHEDLGLYTRFLAALLAKNDCVLIHDDDLYLPPPSVEYLYTQWKKNPEALHGRFGRRPRANNEYATAVEQGSNRAPIVLTRALLAHRRFFPMFFAVAPLMEKIQRHGKPYGNGEDIMFSYIVRSQNNGAPHYVHRCKVRKLPSPHAIHSVQQGTHRKHRTAIMQECARWLQRTLRKENYSGN